MKTQIFRAIEPVIIWFIDALSLILELLTRFVDWLGSKVWGKRKRKHRLLAQERMLVEFTERVRIFIKTYQHENIVAVLFSSQRVLSLFDRKALPNSIYGIPIKWIGADDCDFAIEVLSEFTSETRIITPMDSDYSGSHLR